MAKVRKKRQLLGNIILGILILVAVMVQTSVFPYFKLWGVVPNITLAFLCAAAVFAKPEIICVYSVISGFILACLGSGNVVYYPITFLTAVCISLLFSKTITISPFVSSVLSALTAFVCDGVVTLGLTMYFYSGAPVGSVILHTVLPSIGYSVIVFLPIYLICKIHYKIFG